MHPRISSRIGNKKLIFAGYSSDQMFNILSARLPKDSLEDSALRYICAHHARNATDIRILLRTASDLIKNYNHRLPINLTECRNYLI